MAGSFGIKNRSGLVWMFEKGFCRNLKAVREAVGLRRLLQVGCRWWCQGYLGVKGFDDRS